MSAVEVVTFGCRLNASESEVIRARAAAAGMVDAIVFNTCAVTAEAERQARQAIRKARRARPSATIVVTGCSAEIDPARYAAMPEVDRVVPNGAKLDADALAAREAARVNGIMDLAETGAHLIAGYAERARAFVQVQNGCDHRCTFCIIPYGRGASRSVPIPAIVAEAARLAGAGVNEIVLTGVDITAYGADLPGRPSLGEAAAAILKGVPALPRLRFSSLDVAEVDETLMRLLADEPRVMPHLHLSLQAGSDLILKRMKRRHTRAQAVAFVERARRLRPDVALGADLIAGFPTETEAMFAETLALVTDCGLAHLHVFPFSARPGTPAARMPQVAPHARRERAARLRAAGERALADHLLGFAGRTVAALAESEQVGRTEHYAPIRLDRPVVPGSVVAARVRSAEARQLHGAVLG